MEGYHKLARLMARDPPLAIFRRFSKLNILNVLYLQAELAELEEDWEKTALRDEESSDGTDIYSRNWFKLATAKGEKSLCWTKFLVLRAKLDEYGQEEVIPWNVGLD